MSSPARIAFSNALIDLSQPASLKIIETDGRLQLCLILGINAKKVSETEPGDSEKFRDALINKELFISGKANIGMKKISPTRNTATFTVVFDGEVGTKVPGTGEFRLLKFDFDGDSFTFQPALDEAMEQ